jgi:hypothetical protein
MMTSFNRSKSLISLVEHHEAPPGKGSIIVHFATS